MSVASSTPILSELKLKRRLIAIAGNPNAGKTTLFNVLCGTRQKVANYAGVTVERKLGSYPLPSGEIVDVVDLPGCYSLAARSPEEQIAHDVILGESAGLAKPDQVIVVVDASNLRRNLYLATQLHDLGIPIVVALNMMDLAKQRGFEMDPEKLSEAIGCPVIPIVARKGEGIEALAVVLERNPCDRCACGKIPKFIDCLPKNLEAPVKLLADGLVESGLCDEEHARAEAMWLLISTLEGDDAVKISRAQAALTARILSEFKLTTRQVRVIETSARYRYLKDLMVLSAAVEQNLPHKITDFLDRILLHRVFGPLIFLVVMTVVFQSIFSWAEPAMGWIETGVGWIAGLASTLLPDGLFRGLIVDGVISGVGNVLVFLPQILILFLFIGLLEDLGYMARAAFLMDRIMSKVGLDGRAFVPLLSSFACAIPGIMATRTIAGKKDRLVTILVAPLMSCSARLPVYTLIIGTVFAANRMVLGIFTLGGLVLMSMYLLSIFAGIGIAALFKHTILKSPKPPLFLELPTYKLPAIRTVLMNLADRAKLFVIRAGTVILAVTVILWAAMNIQVVHTNDVVNDPAAKVEHSIGGQLGKWIEPVIAPLGFDWKMGIGIISSFAAREVFVSALGVVHGVTDADESSETLREKLLAEKNPRTGTASFTPLVGLSLMVFFVLACQCMSTVAIVRRETLSWKWPLFMVGYMTVLAWVGSFAVYQGGKLLGLS